MEDEAGIDAVLRPNVKAWQLKLLDKRKASEVNQSEFDYFKQNLSEFKDKDTIINKKG